MKVKNMTISGVRGVPSLQLNFEGKNVLIYGENGTGKSSIIDAIEFFFTGTVSRFKGIQAISFNAHFPHVDYKLEDMKVEASINPGGRTLIRTVSDVPHLPNELEEEFSMMADGTFILRRTQILSFITSKPSERYQVIAAMLGIQVLETVEAEMVKVIKKLEAEKADNKSKITSSLKEIQTELGSSIKDLDQMIVPLNDRLTIVGLPTVSSIGEIDSYTSKPELGFYDLSIREKVEKISLAFALLPDVFLSKDISNRLHIIEEYVRSHRSEERQGNNNVLNLFESGKRSLAQTENGVCPLCQQDIDTPQLLGDIDDRLRSLKQFKEESEKVDLVVSGLVEEIKAAISEMEKAMMVVRDYPALHELEGDLNLNLASFEKVIEELGRTQTRVELMDRVLFEHNIDEANGTLSKVHEFGKMEVDKIAPSTEENERLKTLIAMERIRSAKNSVLQLESEASTIEKKLNYADKIHETFSEVRKRNLQNLFDDIIVDVGRFYKALHPEDDICDIKLSIIPERRGSAELTVTCFAKGNEDPRAYLSEGHLDSLGLCIFLAFIKRLDLKCPLVALDDVVTTVDSGHRERICELLYSEFGDAQIVITTHDGVWFEQLLSYQRASNVPSTNLEIISWTPKGGPIIRSKKSCWETIQDKISDGDRCGAGNEGRRYLEIVLEELCLMVKANVQFKGGSYRFTAGDLFIAFRKRAKDTIVEQEYEEAVLPLIQNLDRTRYMGNLLSHNNEGAYDVSMEEVRSFCNSVNELDKLFLCPECSRRMQYFDRDRIITCSNPKCAHLAKINTK
ncbi:MAG: AAA family ATPase [Methanomassiliicoccales archaeon]|jgi:DNA repair exonuclease SbcCD ATPase subunit